MKKRLMGLITVVLSAIMVISGFAGCNLVTTDTERDLNQVVATVNLSGKAEDEENVYKKDLIMSYLNYGYLYVQYYGYSAAQTYNLILNSLVENRIMVQCAYEELEEVNSSATTYKAEKYISAEDKLDAEYNTYLSVNNLLKSYTESATGDKKSDSVIGDVRTVPTNAANAEKELTEDEKRDYIAKGFDIGSDEYARGAFNSVVKLLTNNYLLGKDFDGTLQTTDYFKQLLKSNYESKVIEKYEEKVLKEVYDSITFADLEASFSQKLDKQKAWSNSDFVSALSSATAESPILYSAYGTYGYVYNLLIGVNDYQSAEISDLQSKRTSDNLTEEEYSEKRAEILKATIAKDLRSTWILSGYDFDGEKFTGDYTFAKDPANSLAFQGEAVELVKATEEDNAVYGVKSVKSFELDEFLDFVKDYVYDNQSLAEGTTNSDIYAAYTRADKPAEYDAKINELLFAFSTDSGSLNTYKGYTIKPAVDGSNKEEYVKTFGDAGRALLQEGGSSFKVVASDYGYHFMFFSEVFNVGDGFDSLSDYLDTLGIEHDGTWADYFEAQKADWEAFAEENNYVYFIANELISSKLSDVTAKSRTAIVNKYRYEETGKVVIFADRYANLLG